MKLALDPPAAPVGTTIVAFLGDSSRFSTWADLAAQGVFVETDRGWVNGVRYEAAPLSEAALLAEANRGAALPVSGTPPCEAEPASRDAGADGG